MTPKEETYIRLECLKLAYKNRSYKSQENFSICKRKLALCSKYKNQEEETDSKN
ncbi:MAG TPA: hypothetical protein VK809_06540 [Bacteroidia bacterium]|jgi:hypothetical protein|nr:hypothetical protein [Bacteroidia bacterium]